MIASTDAERIVELVRDNRRLRRLLDQRNAPGELRHRLQSTLALMRAVIRKSATAGPSLPDYVAHLEDRLDAIVRAQAQADQHGKVDLQTLLVDELFRYGAAEGGRLTLSGPDLQLQPRPGQVLALAVHELAVNAVQHGALGADGGRVGISWHVTVAGPDATLGFTWEEFGPPLGSRSIHKGFGTEMLTRMLAYELKARTELTFKPDGLICAIRLPFSDEVGEVTPG